MTVRADSVRAAQHHVILADGLGNQLGCTLGSADAEVVLASAFGSAPPNKLRMMK